MKLHHTYLMLFWLASPACVIDTVPLPDERDPTAGTGEPPASGDSDYSSPTERLDPAALYTAGSVSPVLLVGVPGCTLPSAEIRVTTTAAPHWLGATQAAADGSFNVPVNAGLGDTLEISVMVASSVVARRDLPLGPPSADATAAQAAFANYVAQYGADLGNAHGSTEGTVLLTPPDPNGLVGVSGRSRPGVSVILANINKGTSVAMVAALDGSFAGSLSGESGDMLQLFAVEAAVSNAGAAPVTVRVP